MRSGLNIRAGSEPKSEPKKMSFHFNAIKGHLTYKTHIPLSEIRNVIGGDYRILSVVHELGDEDEDIPTPYAHTHVFVWWKTKFQTRDPRAWDIGDIHPNMKTDRAATWAKHICMKYHLGHKTKKDGKKYFKEPEWLHQEGIEEWKFEEELVDSIIAAPTLRDAILDAGIVPKSIADCKTLRMECKRKRAEIEDECDRDKFVEIDWDRKRALVLQGPPGIGKTNWSLAQFENPSLICDLDDLKNLPTDCDGLVFDEMIFYNSSKKTQTYLCDMGFDRTIRTRNTNAVVPKGTPRIFCCNFGEEVFDIVKCPNLVRENNPRMVKLVRREPLFN